MLVVSKAPGAHLDYMVDWETWLGGDTISLSEFAVDIGDDELLITDESNTSTRCTVWLDNGTEGQSYYVRNHITTDGGREDERSFVVTIERKTD